MGSLVDSNVFFRSVALSLAYFRPDRPVHFHRRVSPPPGWADGAPRLATARWATARCTPLAHAAACGPAPALSVSGAAPSVRSFASRPRWI